VPNFQTPWDENPSPVACDNLTHVACALILDTSGSMCGAPIEQLNKGLSLFVRQTTDATLQKCIDVALVSFGETVKSLQNFMPIGEMGTAPELAAGGGTPMGGALDLALDLIEQRKNQYKENSTPYHRPWVFCITDGAPTDDYLKAAQRLKELERKKKVLGYCVGVDGFNASKMKEIFDKDRIFKLDNIDFPSLFEFLSTSLEKLADSNPEEVDSVEVPAPKTLRMGG